MFTGLIEEIGIVDAVIATPTGRRLSIRTHSIAKEIKTGESVAVNGVCLTAVGPAAPGSASRSGKLVADILQKTWEVTNLSGLRVGDDVNLERALRMGDRLCGHYVLGHVDGQGIVRSRGVDGTDLVLGIEIGTHLEAGMVPRGSVAVDGVSLTVARLQPGVFYAHLIPHTRNGTTLDRKTAGMRVNIELDILGKYVSRQTGTVITAEFLRSRGFL